MIPFCDMGAKAQHVYSTFPQNLYGERSRITTTRPTQIYKSYYTNAMTYKDNYTFTITTSSVLVIIFTKYNIGPNVR